MKEVGERGRNRTYNLLIKSQCALPIELRVHVNRYSNIPQPDHSAAELLRPFPKSRKHIFPSLRDTLVCQDHMFRKPAA